MAAKLYSDNAQRWLKTRPDTDAHFLKWSWPEALHYLNEQGFVPCFGCQGSGRVGYEGAVCGVCEGASVLSPKQLVATPYTPCPACQQLETAHDCTLCLGTRAVYKVRASGYQLGLYASKFLERLRPHIEILGSMAIAQPGRESWACYYMRQAYQLAERSTCPGKHVGAIIVSPEGVPVAQGYNGAPSRWAHCDAEGCDLTQNKPGRRGYSRHVHAEANAIARAARVGARLDGSTLYVTLLPCGDCLKLCVQAGIKAIVFDEVSDPTWLALAEQLCHDSAVTLRPVAEVQNE